MKTTLTDRGWVEVTAKHFNIEKFSSRNPMMSVKDWVEFIKRLKLDRKRKTCDCCKRPWIEVDGGVNLVFTNKGSKAICDNCLKTLKDCVK